MLLCEENSLKIGIDLHEYTGGVTCSVKASFKTETSPPHLHPGVVSDQLTLHGVAASGL